MVRKRSVGERVRDADELWELIRCFSSENSGDFDRTRVQGTYGATGKSLSPYIKKRKYISNSSHRLRKNRISSVADL